MPRSPRTRSCSSRASAVRRALEDRLQLDEGAETLDLVEVDAGRVQDPQLPLLHHRPAHAAALGELGSRRGPVGHGEARVLAHPGRAEIRPLVADQLGCRHGAALRAVVRLLAQLEAAGLDTEVRVDLVKPTLVAGTGRTSTFGDGGEVVAGAFVSTFVRGMPGSLPSRRAAVSGTGLAEGRTRPESESRRSLQSPRRSPGKANPALPSACCPRRCPLPKARPS